MSDKENAPVFKKFYDVTIWLLDRVERYPRMSRMTLAVRIGDLCIETLIWSWRRRISG